MLVQASRLTIIPTSAWSGMLIADESGRFIKTFNYGIRSIWKCPFCKERLKATVPRRVLWLFLPLLHLPHRCPHCMDVYVRFPLYLPFL